MLSIKPYLVIPKLIPQPTWGGSYIFQYKNISQPEIFSVPIGQSYELSASSLLSQKSSSFSHPFLQILDPKSSSTKTISQRDDPFPLQSLINQNPKKVLGPSSRNLKNNQLDLLIKFTQAQGNSYQLHVRQDSLPWLSKPEFWYFLEPGSITLGIKPDIDLKKYKHLCQQIYQRSLDLSQKVQSHQITIKKASIELHRFIQTEHPRKYVNSMQIKKHSAIDLTSGGIHHSWEQCPSSQPFGNIVFEIQRDVSDIDSTIRCFDQGKISTNGIVRPLNIEAYFQHLDSQVDHNHPQKHFVLPKVIKHTSSYTIKNIFESIFFSLHSLHFSKTLKNQHTTTTTSFHHLFVSQGNCRVTAKNHTFIVTRGYSIFIPVSVGIYSLSPFKSKHVTILKTFV